MLTWIGSRRIAGPHDVTVPDEVHRALRVIASEHGGNADGTILGNPERTLKPARRVRLGDALAALGHNVGLTDEDIATIDQMRHQSPAMPTPFERSSSTPSRSLRR
jgi:plasmid stability protein